MCGFSKSIDYEKLSGGWSAVRQGARLIGTNADREFAGEDGLLMPANGAALAYLSTAGKEPIVIGKPGIAMAELALEKLGAEKNSARVAVLGDTIDQDVMLAENLKNAGWNAEAWVVLTGVLGLTEAESDPRIARIFDRITQVREQILLS